MNKENPQASALQEKSNDSLELALKWAEEKIRNLQFQRSMLPNGRLNTNDVATVVARLPHAELLLGVIELCKKEGLNKDEIASQYARAVMAVKKYGTETPQKPTDKALVFSRRLARLAAEGEIFRGSHSDREIDFFIKEIKPALNFVSNEKTKSLPQESIDEYGHKALPMIKVLNHAYAAHPFCTIEGSSKDFVYVERSLTNKEVFRTSPKNNP